jgi:hypothetical protein
MCERAQLNQASDDACSAEHAAVTAITLSVSCLKLAL